MICRCYKLIYTSVATDSTWFLICTRVFVTYMYMMHKECTAKRCVVLLYVLKAVI